MVQVLIADRLDECAAKEFEARGVEVSYQPELAKDAEKFRTAVAEYDGLAVRSAAKVTAEVIGRAAKLRVIGRAGVGIDTIDVSAATARGIAVMNTPFGNTVTTAEHTVAMMAALARHIPQADASVRAGRWERSRFVGTELDGKSLGVVGCGNVGAAVVVRAIGLGMRVFAFDPFLPAEKAEALGATRVETVEELLERVDFVSLHVPRTESTKNLLSAERIARMKPGARLINCARGGLVDEEALHAALVDGHLAGAALDVFATEPVDDSPLLKLDNVVATPHLGASTAEAQVKVAEQIARQMCDFLLDGTVSNAVNLPSVTAAEAAQLRPWMAVAETLGTFAGQVTESPITEISIDFVGEAGKLNVKPLTAVLIAALLRPKLGDGVNIVSAPEIARERGMRVSENLVDARGAFGSYMRLLVSTDRQTRSIAGAVFSDGKPRIIQIKGVGLEAVPQPHMIYATNVDQPGFIGAIGTVLGEAGVNIATFALGRSEPGGEAITLLGVDEAPDEQVLEQIRALPQTKQVKAVRFG